MNIIKALSLVFIVTLLLTTIGCNESELSTDEIAAKILKDAQTIETYQLDGTMAGTIDMSIGGDEPDSTRITYSATMMGTIDKANREAQMTMDMAMTSTEAELNEINMGIDMYLVENTIYQKIDMGISFMPPYWVKQQLNEEYNKYWDNQDNIQDIIDVLESYKEVELVGFDTVDGVDCYVIRVVPDMEKVMDMALSTMDEYGAELGESLETDSDFSEFSEAYVQAITDMIENFTMKIWAAKDTLRIMKDETNMILVMTPEIMKIISEETGEELDEAEVEGSNLRMDMEMSQQYSKFNQSVSIELPEEALNAQDISELEFGVD